MPASHPEDELLDRYASGTLPEQCLAGVEEHLLTCTECQSRLKTSDEFVMLFRMAAVESDVRQGHGWRLFWKPGVAIHAASWTTAVAMLAILLLLKGPFDGTPTAPAPVLMQALRGPEASAEVTAGKRALLVFDLVPAAGVNYEARIVNPVGAEIRASKVSTKDGHLAAVVERLLPGSYWVRVYRTDAPEPLTEYGLRAR